MIRLDNSLSACFCAVAIALVAVEVKAYEVCTPENSYLENELSPLSEMLESALPIECVKTAQLTLPKQGYYGYCPTDVGRPARTHPRPCISELYVGNVYEHLSDVTTCFGYNPRWLFSVLSLESALHINAVGGAYDAGIGQLTATAIREINLNVLPRALRLAKVSPLPACQRVLPFMTEGDPTLDKRCSFLVAPKNPGHNLVFSTLLLLRNRTLVENYFTRLDIRLPERVNVDRVKAMLSLLAYNAGAGGITSALKTYSVEHADHMSNALFDFENVGPRSFAYFLLKNFPSADEGIRKRVSKYLGHVIGATRNVESRLVLGLCSDPELLYPAPHTQLFKGVASPSAKVSESSRLETQRHFLRLAEAFSQEKSAPPKGDLLCEQRQSEFAYSFLAKGQEMHELPLPIQEVYHQLCQ